MSKQVTPETLTRFKTPGDPQINPTGTHIAHTLTRYDLEDDKQVTDIHIVDVESKETIEITDDGVSSTPRWSPDGTRLAYFTTIDEVKHLQTMNPDGSDKQTATTLEQSNAFIHRSGEKLSWSPDGSTLLYTATPDPKPDHTDIITTDRQIMYNLTGHIDDRRTHIYTVKPGEQPIQHTNGPYDNHSPVWTPDGKIVYLSDRTPLHDQHVNYQVYIQKNGKETQLTDTKGAYYRPVVSPDGKWIACQKVNRPMTCNDSVSEDSHLYAVSIDGPQEVHVTQYLDRPIYSHTWTPDNKLLFTAADTGTRNLYIADLDRVYDNINPGQYQVPWGAVPTSANGVIAYVKTTPSEPHELYILRDGEETRLTNHNKFIENYSLVKPESFWFRTWDGHPTQGWISKPTAYQEGERYPTLLCIHGGPHGSFGPGFDERTQLFASNGYVVIQIDPRGSSGYGQFWSDGCLNNWGGGDYHDLMAGVDHCIETYPFIDADRLGVTGGSYGGYMTNWVVTQTHRFKAGVSRACVTNLLSFYGTSAVGSLIEQEFNGDPWSNLALLAQWSPITHAHKCRTPLLLLHGTSDMTCPPTQSEEMFRALKRTGTPTRIVRYKGEGHGIRKKPSLKTHYYQQHLDWFKKYILSE